jgi:hypothetical protein
MTSTNTYTDQTIPHFYVYAYIRSKDSKTATSGTPYYIGKGSGNRAYNKHHFKLPEKSSIIILKSNLTEQEAFQLEIELINKYGRKDLGTGILINCSGGGTGNSGLSHSENTKKLLSEITKSKEMQLRLKSTRLSKYNDENFNNREKCKQTTLEKYGVDNISKSEIIKQKKINTSLEKYGVDNPLKYLFLSIIETKKSYAKNIISRKFPELKLFY